LIRLRLPYQKIVCLLQHPVLEILLRYWALDLDPGWPRKMPKLAFSEGHLP
jgi:hypothetical protein